MSYYQKLENSILSKFKIDNLKLNEEDSKFMEQLVDFFNKYWKVYQDKWTPKYWEIYESLHEKDIDSKKDDIWIYFNDQQDDKKITCNNSNLDNNTYCKIFNVEEKVNVNYINAKANSTNNQTKTFINLQDIDDELEKINDVSLIKDTNEPEKRRNCFDCLIF